MWVVKAFLAKQCQCLAGVSCYSLLAAREWAKHFNMTEGM